jgi:2-polyprenyl-3-methyl-5-hydroxy-6-metoxy-1,4-benzoquinol methylase
MTEKLSIGAQVDTLALMEEIRAEVARKRAAGAYPPDIVHELDDLSHGLHDPGDALRSALNDLRRTSGFTPEITTASSKPVVAPVVSRSKRAIRAGLRWYLSGILQQITTFAGNVARTVALLADRTAATDEKVAEVTATAARIEPLEVSVAELRATLDDLGRRFSDERVGDRLARLDRAVRDLRERVESGAGATPAAAATHGEARSFTAEKALDYFEFENRFRGSEESVAERQGLYLDRFAGMPGRVVDLGCGRGEFLGLLRDAGVDSYGVDRHGDMVALCRERGLDVTQSDSIEHLSSLEPGSLGGVFCAQMIEHLEMPDVPRFFELAASAIAPAGRLVVETINPQCLFVFASAFYVDLGHSRPLHPLTLTFLARTAGFSSAEVEFLNPVPPDFRPAKLEADGLGEVIDRINDNFRRIDDVLFGPQDYAVVAQR